MGRVRASLDLEHDLDEVWDLFTDPDRWLEWNTELAGMRDVRGPFDHPGSGYTQVWRAGPFEREGRWEVVECHPASWRTVRGRTPIGLDFTAREEFVRRDDGSTVTVEIAWPSRGGRLGAWFDRHVGEPLLRRALDRNAQRIRAVLDRG